MQTSVSIPQITTVSGAARSIAARIGGLSPAPKTGLTSTEARAGTRASTRAELWPFLSGSSSVTTAGTASPAAMPATQATRSRYASNAARSTSVRAGG